MRFLQMSFLEYIGFIHFVSSMNAIQATGLGLVFH
jgi:hypothetical protein